MIEITVDSPLSDRLTLLAEFWCPGVSPDLTLMDSVAQLHMVDTFTMKRYYGETTTLEYTTYLCLLEAEFQKDVVHEQDAADLLQEQNNFH